MSGRYFSVALYLLLLAPRDISRAGPKRPPLTGCNISLTAVFDNKVCLPALFQALRTTPQTSHMWGAAQGHYRLGQSWVSWAHSLYRGAWRDRCYLHGGGHRERWALLTRCLLGAVTPAALPRCRLRCMAIGAMGVILPGRGEHVMGEGMWGRCLGLASTDGICPYGGPLPLPHVFLSPSIHRTCLSPSQTPMSIPAHYHHFSQSIP